MPLRRRLYSIIEHDEADTGPSYWINIALIVLIALNVLAVIMETVEPVYAAYALWFDAFDTFSVIVFSVEYVIRVWTSVESRKFAGRGGRLRYMLTPMAVIDLLAILPFYLGLIFGADLRILRALRLLRVFKLTRYSSAMNMLLDVLKEEAGPLAACFFILFILLVVTASGAYLVERDLQPDDFGSIPDAMWWALVTLTTVGYGDVTPLTLVGRIFGGAVTVIGVGMAALPAGILASGVSDHLHRRRDDLRLQFRKALQDGVIDDEEEHELEELRKRLGLSREVAGQIRTDVMSEEHSGGDLCTCPHCGTRFRG